MKVCLVTAEFFCWGNYGGFGAFTRKLAKELVKHGIGVKVLMGYKYPFQPSFGKSVFIDGACVTTLPNVRDRLLNHNLFKTDADIIHSQNDPLNTYFVFKSNPSVPKVVTIQDLRTPEERKRLTADSPSIEWGMPGGKQILLSPVVWHCARSNLKHANVVACQAHLLKPKIKSVLNYSGRPLFLPNFVEIPESQTLKKSDRPTVVFLGRLDSVKNPELTFDVAKKVPNIDFYILGSTRTQGRTLWLQKQAEGIDNLHLLGHNSGNLKEKLLSEAWVLINTSYYECMPVSFLEALAHKCCLLSTQNPDGYTESFGFYDKSFSVNGLVYGLNFLIKNDVWRLKGECGYEYVKKVHNIEKGIEDHICLYKTLLDSKK